jgi:diaminopimelate epimerase
VNAAATSAIAVGLGSHIIEISSEERRAPALIVSITRIYHAAAARRHSIAHGRPALTRDWQSSGALSYKGGHRPWAMSTLSDHAFVKMNGLGNEIVVVDMRAGSGPIPADEVRAAGRAVKFDQMMVLCPPRIADTDAVVRIYNCDGSEAGACGNGMRCLAALLHQETGRNQFCFETPAGLLACWAADAGQFTADLGRPRFSWDEIPLAEPFADTRAIELQIGPIDAPILFSPSVVNVGNPHALFWVDDVDAYDLGAIGPMLENHPIFPQRANISLVRVCAKAQLKVRTWERGAGLTKACGSAACAAVVAAARTGRTGRTARASLPGGDLEISWRARDDHVLMTGPAVWEYRGRFDPAVFVKAGAA